MMSPRNVLRRLLAATSIGGSKASWALIGILGGAAVVTTASVTFDQIQNGTNTQCGACVIGTGAALTFSGTGLINANELNGATIPTNAGLVQTNASGQVIQSNGAAFTPLTYAAISAIGCTSGNNGAAYWITDATTTTFNATISSGGGSNAVLAVCNGSAWTVH